jgi:hypothetical protein
MKRGGFFCAKRPTLELETSHRSGGETAEILWVSRTKVTLSGNMQSHRLRDRRAESIQQMACTELFMPVIDAAQRRAVVGIVEQVANIMQQRSRDERRGSTGLRGQKSALERVLALRDPLFPVLPDTGGCKQVEQAVDDLVHPRSPTIDVILS